MFFHAHGLAAICGVAPAGPALFLAMLVAGLAGSALHCVPMCGPFVIGQVTDRLAAVPAAKLCEMTRIRGALLLPYHAGRLLTYAGLGAASAVLGAMALRLGPAPAILLAAAGGVCAVNGLRRLVPRGARPSGVPAASRVGRTLVRLGARLDRSRAAGSFLLGVLLGFLPCGLIYAALIAAAATGSAPLGSAAMMAFGLGTIPALVMVGLAGSFAGAMRRQIAGKAGGALMLANAALLWTVALGTL
jgi:sulfite exporter TauE/SafE